MNLIKFIESFPDESSCMVKFKEFRDEQGIIEKYECKKCKTRTSLRSGTVMQESKLPFRHWFIAIAIKAYAMEILYNLVLIYPELHNELSATINVLEGEGSAGVVARGRMILKKLAQTPIKPRSSQK